MGCTTSQPITEGNKPIPKPAPVTSSPPTPTSATQSPHVIDHKNPVYSRSVRPNECPSPLDITPSKAVELDRSSGGRSLAIILLVVVLLLQVTPYSVVQIKKELVLGFKQMVRGIIL